MLLRIFIAAVVICLVSVSVSVAGAIPSGYEKVSWNVDLNTVTKKFPKGQVMSLGQDVVYKQQKPSKKIARRNFAFSKGQLRAVSVTFDKDYVQKVGLHNLLVEQIKKYGEGVMDRSQAPHMINYIWQGSDTKIVFAYAPQRPDMSVLYFESKKTAGR